MRKFNNGIVRGDSQLPDIPWYCNGGKPTSRYSMLLRHWCTNPCCSTTAQFVFLVRVARYANHFSSLLGSPKIPFCWVQFLSSRTSRMRLIFCSHSANFPKIHAAIVQASAAHHCKLPGLGTVFLLSFVRP